MDGPIIHLYTRYILKALPIFFKKIIQNVQSPEYNWWFWESFKSPNIGGASDLLDENAHLEDEQRLMIRGFKFKAKGKNVKWDDMNWWIAQSLAGLNNLAKPIILDEKDQFSFKKEDNHVGRYCWEQAHNYYRLPGKLYLILLLF